jgi:membrane associated rhomboid family serine protease
MDERGDTIDSTVSGQPAYGAAQPAGAGGQIAPPPDRGTAIAMLAHADELLESSEPEQALAFYTTAANWPDRDVAAAASFGAGNALYRLDREVDARGAWERATSFGETPVAYRAWRQVAAALVREGDLRAALGAYRECEKRAPRADRAEIASRLGWLNKEAGNTGAASRYFARSRGDTLPSFMTYLIIAATVVTSLVAMTNGHATNQSPLGGPLEQSLGLDKFAVAHGELYRMLSVVLVHDPSNILHLLFNMYALWFAGQVVERMYGSVATLVFYVLAGIAGSVGSLLFGDAAYGVGASGAIFGLFGVVLVATRVHHAILDAESRAIASQIGILILLNLVIGFSGALNVDNFAHLGGLGAGAWLGLVFRPGRVATMGSMWQSPRATPSRARTIAIRLGGTALLLAVLGAGTVAGMSRWQSEPYYHYRYGTAAQPAVNVVAAAPASFELRAGPD